MDSFVVLIFTRAQVGRLRPRLVKNVVLFVGGKIFQVQAVKRVEENAVQFPFYGLEVFAFKIRMPENLIGVSFSVEFEYHHVAWITANTGKALVFVEVVDVVIGFVEVHKIDGLAKELVFFFVDKAIDQVSPILGLAGFSKFAPGNRRHGAVGAGNDDFKAQFFGVFLVQSGKEGFDV